MSAQIAIIITLPDLQKMVDDAVAKKTAEIRASFERGKDLPVEMTVRQAAAYLGISETTFHRNRSHLKQYRDNRVFVLGKDLIR